VYLIAARSYKYKLPPSETGIESTIATKDCFMIVCRSLTEARSVRMSLLRNSLINPISMANERILDTGYNGAAE